MKINGKVKFSPYDIDRMGNNGELRKALDIALEQIRNGVSDTELYYVAARIAFDLCDISKAEQLAKLLLAADPDHINGWVLYGRIHSQKGDASRADYGMKRAEEIFPGLAQIDIVRQLAKPQPSDMPIAKIEAKPIAEAKTVNESSFDTATFAEICIKQGYLNKAMKIYKDLKTKNPGNIDIDERIEELKRKIEKND